MAGKETAKKTTFDYVNDIWNIADFVWGPVHHADFHKIVLPFSLLRRLECALEPTKDKVLAALEEHEGKWGRESENYCQFSGKAFYNVSKFTLATINTDEPWRITLMVSALMSGKFSRSLTWSIPAKTCWEAVTCSMVYARSFPSSPFSKALLKAAMFLLSISFIHISPKAGII